MTGSVEIILVPTVMIIIGILLRKFNVLREEDSVLLSRIVLDISLPSLIFINISKAAIGGEMIYMPIIAFTLSIICMLIAYLYSKMRRYTKMKTWTIIILLAMMNTAFIGYPVVMGVFGNEGFLYAIFYDFAMAIMLVVFGTILSSFSGGNNKEVIKNGLKFVPLWAVIIGLIFNMTHISLPYVIENALNYLGASAIPLIMLSIGLKINFRSYKSVLTDSIFITISRLIIAPLILYTILTTTGFTGYVLKVSVVQSAMPTAMNVMALAITNDLDVELTNSVILMTTISSVITLPLIINFII